MSYIPPDLHEGDTFEDGGRWFRVLKVLEDGNYSSEYIGIKKPRKTADKKRIVSPAHGAGDI